MKAESDGHKKAPNNKITARDPRGSQIFVHSCASLWLSKIATFREAAANLRSFLTQHLD